MSLAVVESRLSEGISQLLGHCNLFWHVVPRKLNKVICYVNTYAKIIWHYNMTNIRILFDIQMDSPFILHFMPRQPAVLTNALRFLSLLLYLTVSRLQPLNITW